MKVVAKFAVWFFAVSVALLRVYGYLSARAEAQALARAAEVDTLEIGSDLREVIVAVWTSDGEKKALALVDVINARRHDVDLRWIPGEPDDARGEARTTREDAGPVVRARVPIRVGREGGWLEVRRAVPDERTILREQLRAELAVAGALAVAAALLAVVLGGALIGRPLQRIEAQARRIGEGDLSQRLAVTRSDEIGTLKRELNAMCDRLAEAQRRVESESTARIETLEQLRHLDRLRTVGTMASSLAHELGTPLAVLRLRGEELAAEGATPGDVKDAGETVLAQVEKMRRLVSQLLDFARRKPGARGEVHLAEVARRSARLLETLAKKHGVTLRVEIVDDPVVSGDVDNLEQAVTNLVVNGVQAMPKGGELSLVVRALAAGEGERPYGKDGPAGVIEVVDEGVGLSEADLARIFEPFYTTKPAGLGTGLGLTVARDIAQDHGGHITAASTPGRGSAFSLHVPRLR